MAIFRQFLGWLSLLASAHVSALSADQPATACLIFVRFIVIGLAFDCLVFLLAFTPALELLTAGDASSLKAGRLHLLNDPCMLPSPLPSSLAIASCVLAISFAPATEISSSEDSSAFRAKRLQSPTDDPVLPPRHHLHRLPLHVCSPQAVAL